MKKIIHWTDPDYLNAFYSGWGSGQSITSRQAPPAKPKGNSKPYRADEDDDVTSSEAED